MRILVTERIRQQLALDPEIQNIDHSLLKGSTRLSWLLQGSSFVFPAKQPPSKDYLLFMEKTRIELENREYKQMVADLVPPERVPLARDLKQVHRILLGITNSLFSIVGVFGGVYYASYTVSNDVSIRILIALTCAMAVLVAESWFFTRDFLV